MNTVVVKQGADGKLYPAEPLTDAQRHQARTLAHALVCRDGLSIRAAQQVLLDSYALRRSVGAIHYDLTHFACRSPRCPSVPAGPVTQPAAREERPAAVVHDWSGGSGGSLTAQLRGSGDGG